MTERSDGRAGSFAALAVLAALLALSLALTGCGRKSDLEPPPSRVAAER